MRIVGLFLLIFGNGYALYALSQFVFPDALLVTGPSTWASFGLIGLLFTIVNFLIRPIIFLISVPLRFITMGLFSFVLNAGLLWLVAEAVNFLAIGGITMTITGIITYLVVGAALAVVNSVLHWFV